MNFTERLFQKTDVRSFYERRTKLRKLRGKPECQGLCPLHEEKTPSFSVNLETGSFYCFGCTAGGGPVQFEAKRLNISDEEACKHLAKEYGLRVSRKEESPSPLTTANRELRTEILAGLLSQGRPLADRAVAYFSQRRIHRDTLDRFQVAFLPDPAKAAAQLQKDHEISALLEAGVFRTGKGGKSYFGFRRHPLLFPILREGRPVYLQGRRMDEGKPKFMNLSEVTIPGLFNQDRLKDHDPNQSLFLCEGAPDTMILEQEGLAAVGIIGAGGFKAEWVDPLKPFNVHLALDPDSAGRSGSGRIREIFHQNDRPVWTLPLPEGSGDINDYFLQYGKQRFLDQVVAKARRVEPDLRSIVQGLWSRAEVRSDPFGPSKLGRRIFSWFRNNGGIFLIDPQQRCQLLYERKLYEIGDNRAFNALMLKKTELTNVTLAGRAVWKVLGSLCSLEGHRQPARRWTHRSQDSLYIHLHDDRDRILRLGQGGVEVLQNGDNPDCVLLSPADKMDPIAYEQGVDPRQAAKLFKHLVLDALACPPAERWFVGAWILTAFLLDFSTVKALLKLSGAAESGKTTAARILSTFLYGSNQVEHATVAYLFTDAASNPLLICDDLETADISRRVSKFLLTVSTGIQRGKRQAGTDAGKVREAARALVAVTAIEPLSKRELITRTFEVEFSTLHQMPNFYDDDHCERLARVRGRMLSGLFELMAREVLPGLRSRRRAVLARLQAIYPRHSKWRLDGFFTLLVAVLEALLKVLEPDRDLLDILIKKWIARQSAIAKQSERETNDCLRLLDALAEEMRAKPEDFEKEYYLRFTPTKDELDQIIQVEFTSSPKELLLALEVLSRRKGVRLPFVNTRQLGARLAAESSVLEQAGWERKRGKAVRGVRYHDFVKSW